MDRNERPPSRTRIPGERGNLRCRQTEHPTPAPTAIPAVPRRPEPAPSSAPKHSRKTPDGQTRLYVNAGAEMGVSESDIVGTILGETGLPRKVVGAVDIRERHMFVDVAAEHANGIISKLNRAQLKGRRAKVKVA